MSYTKGELNAKRNATGDWTIATEDTYIGTISRHFNARRIVDCWNGCQGIENPLAVKDVVEVCKLCYQTIKRRHMLEDAASGEPIPNPLLDMVDKVLSKLKE